MYKLKIMKKTLPILLAIIMYSIACKKQATQVTQDNKIIGTWVGKYSGIDVRGYTYDQCWEIKDNGKILVYDQVLSPVGIIFSDAEKGDTATGTYTLSGKNINATYTFTHNNQPKNQLSIQATISDDFKRIEGTKTRLNQAAPLDSIWMQKK